MVVKLQNLPIELLFLVLTKLSFRDFSILKIKSLFFKNKKIQDCINSDIFITHFKKTKDSLYETEYFKNPVLVNFLSLVNPYLLLTDNRWFRQVIKHNDSSTFKSIQKVFGINYEDDTLCYLCSKYDRVEFLEIILHNKKDNLTLDFIYLIELAAKFNNLNIIKFLIKNKYFLTNTLKTNILVEAIINDSIDVFIFFQDNACITRHIIQSLAYKSNRVAKYILNNSGNYVLPLDKLINITVSNGNIEMLSILSKNIDFKHNKWLYLSIKKKNNSSRDYLQRNFSKSKGQVI